MLTSERSEVRKLVIASGCNEGYYPRMKPYMESVQEHHDLDAAYMVGVGWHPPSERGFVGVHLPMEMAIGHSGIYCVQGGSFLDALPLDDDDVIIFTDGGDVKMQRPLDSQERRLLNELDGDTVLVALNDGPKDTLGTEAARLEATGPIPKKFDLRLRCYNTGVIVATVGAYRRLYERYRECWDEVESLFGHYARQQWLISWILGTDKRLRAQRLHNTFHAHGHHGRQGCRIRDGIAVWRGRRVLFRHKL